MRIRRGTEAIPLEPGSLGESPPWWRPSPHDARLLPEPHSRSGRVIGRSVVTAPARRARPLPTFGGREYPLVVELEIESPAPLREGVELAPLVPMRATFPDPKTWSVRMRRALVPLDRADSEVIGRELAAVACSRSEALPTYGTIHVSRDG